MTLMKKEELFTVSKLKLSNNDNVLEKNSQHNNIVITVNIHSIIMPVKKHEESSK